MTEEETGQEVAAEGVAGDNNTGVTEDMLNQAAMDAVAEQPETETERVVEDLQTTEETEVEQETEKLDEEGLPADHAKRSDLGRKVSAMHRRQDTVDERLEKILNVLESQSNLAVKKDDPDPLLGLEPDEPVTVAEFDKLLEARERKAKDQLANYDKTYLKAFNKLTTTLTEDEVNAVVEEMKVLSYDPSKDPAKDAEVNFLKAERAYLRKQLASPKDKKNPITGDKVKAPIGTVTSQKTVTKETTLPKLDAAGASYLAFIESEDGVDRANELHRSLGKG